MFELSDEEDQNFWENLPFEKLDKSVGSGAPQARDDSVYRNVQQPTGIQLKTPVTGVHAEDTKGKKAMKRKFPGPAGNLPQHMPKETLSPECVPACPTIGNSETDDGQVEDQVASQACLEEAFSSRQWKKLLSDLGPDASSILAKFSIKSMLFKANKKRLPRGKIPLMLGYVERVDFQGRDGSIVIRDPSGKMNGSLHQELIKDPSTALQVGWVLVLRQVSVISPSMRNHYLNITTGNIVAVYRLNRENEVMVTSCPQGGTPPLASLPSNSNSSCSTASNSRSFSWHKLVKESEEELTAARTQISRAVTKPSSSVSALNQVRSSTAAFVSKPGPTSLNTGPSPLFDGSSAVLGINNLHSNTHYNPGNYSNTAGPILPNVNMDGFFDDFPDDDDDHEILSLCDMSAIDTPKSTRNGRQSDERDNQPSVEHVPCSYAIVNPVQPASSKPSFSPSNALQTLATANSSVNCDSVKRKSFSFKLTPSISSTSGQSQAGETNQGTKFGFQRTEKNQSISKCSDTPMSSRNLKIHLGGDRNVVDAKENKTEMDNMFGHWNDDLSDELLSQLTEDF